MMRRIGQAARFRHIKQSNYYDVLSKANPSSSPSTVRRHSPKIRDVAALDTTSRHAVVDVIADGTDGRLTSDKVLETIQAGTTLNPNEAKDAGLIHDIIEPTIPAGARCWQV